MATRPGYPASRCGSYESGSVLISRSRPPALGVPPDTFGADWVPLVPLVPLVVSAFLSSLPPQAAANAAHPEAAAIADPARKRRRVDLLLICPTILESSSVAPIAGACCWVNPPPAMDLPSASPLPTLLAYKRPRNTAVDCRPSWSGSFRRSRRCP